MTSEGPMTPGSPMTSGSSAAPGCSGRPRVEGAREEQILGAVLTLLQEIGYDQLTMDAVARASRASKATLYRRWTSKADLVVDAVSRSDGLPAPSDVDTGDLRTDLIGVACADGGVLDRAPTSVMAGLVTALHRDPDLSAVFQRNFLGPRRRLARGVLDRALARGDLGRGADPALLADILPALVVHRALLLGFDVGPADVVDQVVLPACHAHHRAPNQLEENT
jgi:AcrR family transcriptional regulator